MKDFDEFIEAKMNKALFVGMSVAFIEDEEIVFRQNYGYEDRAKGKDVNNKTIFSIASISKLVTGTAVL